MEEHSAPEPDADTTDAALDYFAEVAVACVGVVAGGGLPTPASHLQLPSLSVLEAARGAVEALPQYRFMELARALPVTDAAIAVSTAVSGDLSHLHRWVSAGCRYFVLQSAHCSLS